MARIHGKRGQILLDSTPTSPVNPVALADTNSWSCDMKTDRVVVTAFGDTNVQRVAGLPDFSGGISGWWNSSTTPTFFDVVLAGTVCWLRLVPDTSAATYYFEGLANLDGAIQCSATGAVSMSGNWDAAGNWDNRP